MTSSPLDSLDLRSELCHRPASRGIKEKEKNNSRAKENWGHPLHPSLESQPSVAASHGMRWAWHPAP